MGKVIIIAEAGVNHNGSIELAKKLADKAKEAGADIVKYQTGKPENLVAKSAKMAEYQKENTGKDESQFQMLKKLMLPFDAFDEIFAYCESIGIMPLSTPFDLESIDYLNKKNMPFWKVPSGEITNLPYLEKIAKTGKSVVMSTGMSTLAEVKAAVKLLKDNGSGDITVLQCNTQYPTPYEDVNLRAMLTMKEDLGLPVGYSDHTRGIEIPIAAVAMGASIIEKHFTLDRNMEGPDHKASLEPDELRSMVDSIRHVEAALGSGIKQVSDSERPNIAVARKSIVARCDIKKGELLSEENITTKRPGNGIDPMKWHEVTGTKAVRDFKEDELIEL
ncbi:MAG: N-acetylneuraminate synthase [Lachnospiraceae bacterium]|jgi:N,N'-diacetyllegionaminate synthase|nr:N-acetylneuraminate synthase [Lachnospiraceae bacterium]MEE3460932.1 N-acetylneuraminate synthase [Lachnospiraceae bacterium]